MLFSVPERGQEPRERGATAPQAENAAPQAANAGPQADDGITQRTRAGSRRPTGRPRPSQVPVIQPKLRLGGENDHHEREADRLAERLAVPAERGLRPSAAAHATPVGGAPGTVTDPVIRQLITGAQGQGAPLPTGERRRHERDLGTDLAGVRLHTDPRAGDLNRRLGSVAFTFGRDVFFGHDEYAPASDAGGQVLTHELVHVAQQAGSGPLVQRSKERKRKNPPRRAKDQKRRRVEVEPEEEEPEEVAAEDEADEAVDPEAPDAVEEDFEEESDAEEVVRPTPRKRSASASGTRGVKPAKAAKTVKAAKAGGVQDRRKRSASAGAADAVKPGTRRGKVVPAARRPGFDVTYRKREAMARYLQAEGLKVPDEDARPEPIQVGVVAWNINHLKATADDGTAADEMDVEEGTAADEMDVEEGTDKAPRRRRAATPKEIIDSLMRLRKDLNAASKWLTKAESIKGANEEGSQFATDVKVLAKGEITKAVELGVPAFGEFQRSDPEGASLEVSASQLESIRLLNRLWNRVARVQTTLFTGPVTTGAGGEKKPNETRRKIRTALRETKKANKIERDLDELVKLLDPKEIQKAVTALKKKTVVELTTEQFFRNEAINLVLINEVNLGINYLETEGGPGLSRGPVMLAKGQRIAQDTQEGINLGTEKNPYRVKAKQYEYYPAVYRTGNNGLGFAGSFYVGSTGQFVAQDGSVGNEGIPWDKDKATPDTVPDLKEALEAVQKKRAKGKPSKEEGQLEEAQEEEINKTNKTRQEEQRKARFLARGDRQDAEAEVGAKVNVKASYRGIVVHRFKQGKQEFWAGVLHTTPGGQDLDRREIWPQIEAPLKELHELAKQFKIPLLIGGDFYIPAEGMIKSPVINTKGLSKKERDKIDDDLRKAQAWSLARNLFLKAEETGTIDTLLKNIRSYNEGEEFNEEESQKTKKGKAKKSKSTYQPGPGIVPQSAGDVKEFSGRWDTYRKLISGLITEDKLKNAVNRNGKLDSGKARRRLAPGMNFNDVSWERTLAGGEISMDLILRNYRRLTGNGEEDKGPKAIMELALKDIGYTVVIGANPTNPKEKGAGENKMQLADLFLVNEYWPTSMGGIVTPGKADLRQVDDENLSATRFYTKISDHAPVALIASTRSHDPNVHKTFKAPKSAHKKVAAINQDVWKRMMERLAGVRTRKGAKPKEIKELVDQGLPKLEVKNSTSVKEQIEDIQATLAKLPVTAVRPIPTAEEEAAISVKVDKLRKSIQAVQKKQGLSANQKAAIKEISEDLGRWTRPYYVTDISNKPE
jgi:hypothetical protein